MYKAIKILLFLGMIGAMLYLAITVNGPEAVALSAQAAELKPCKAGEITVDVKWDEQGNAVKHKCYTSEKYDKKKKDLAKEYEDTSKSYDFEIANREELFGILNKEIVAQGGMEIQPPVTKEKIAKELVDLLRN